MRIILTGATGMVGEGVLLECLRQPAVRQVLVIGRRPSGLQHDKLKELIIADFSQIRTNENTFDNYDACFYCAGISALGLDESAYTHITFDTTLHLAQVLKRANPQLIFNFVSGGHTDGTENGKVMWARVKGKTENALAKIFTERQYNFRPGLMKPTKGQRRFKGYNRIIRFLYPLLSPFFPSCTIQQIGLAMINAVLNGYHKNVLEVEDIKILSGIT